MGESLRIVLSSIPFRWFLGANITKEYIWLALGAMLPFWRKYALGIQAPINVFGTKLGAGDSEAVLLGLAILLAIPCLLVWRPIVIKLGYRRTWIIAALVFVPGLFLMLIAKDFYSGLLGTLLTAPGLAGSMIMPFPVISEIIDDDAKKEHGYRREGIFFGMNGGITKLAFSAQGVLFASVMSAAGYVAGEAVQTASAVNGIRFMIGGTTIIATLITAFCMWRYPLGRESHSMK
jgi:GPH family glycoside/pentoside/hexuronide:cation symporter